MAVFGLMRHASWVALGEMGGARPPAKPTVSVGPPLTGCCRLQAAVMVVWALPQDDFSVAY